MQLLTLLEKSDIGRNKIPVFIEALENASSKNNPVDSILVYHVQEFSDDQTQNLIKEKINNAKKEYNLNSISMYPLDLETMDEDDDPIRLGGSLMRCLKSQRENGIIKDSDFYSCLIPNNVHKRYWDVANKNQVIDTKKIKFIDAELNTVKSELDEFNDILSMYVHKSPHIKEVLNKIISYAKRPKSPAILLTGPIGSGKTNLAWVHGHIRRQITGDEPIYVNCGTIFKNHPETHLFGWEPKTYEGGRGFIGPVEKAKSGTLILDEFAKLREEHQRLFNSLLELEPEKRIYDKAGKGQMTAKCHIVATMRENSGEILPDHKDRFEEIPIYGLNHKERKGDKIALFNYYNKLWGEKEELKFKPLQFNESILDWIESMPHSARRINVFARNIHERRLHILSDYKDVKDLNVIQDAYQAVYNPSKKNTSKTIPIPDIKNESILDVIKIKSEEIEASILSHYVEKFRTKLKQNNKIEKISELALELNLEKTVEGKIKQTERDKLEAKLKNYGIWFGKIKP